MIPFTQMQHYPMFGQMPNFSQTAGNLPGTVMHHQSESDSSTDVAERGKISHPFIGRLAVVVLLLRLIHSMTDN